MKEASIKVACPVFAFIGPHKSGKTTAIEFLVSRMSREYKVGVLKHAHAGFSVSKEGKDSWRYLDAGADVVYVKTSTEEVFTYRGGRFSFDEVITVLSPNLDLILVEGFKSEVEEKGYVYKVYVGVPNPKKGYTLSSPPTEEELENLLLTIKDKVKMFKELKELVYLIPWRNCGKCGFKTCLEFLERNYAGEVRRDRCPFLVDRGVEVKVQGRTIPLNPFVSRLIKRVIVSMISCLKGVELSGGEYVKVRLEVLPKEGYPNSR